ncbi:MAG: hypothetical protein QGG64_03390, partial [Candidatus Latescibacteria bacterium]|nr:hypothetical protein [Candidatus Latescibacterota bacterium]
MNNALFHTEETSLSVEDFLGQVCDDSLEEIEKGGKGTRVWKVVVDGKAYFLKSGPAKFLMPDCEICCLNLHPAIPRLHNAIETSDAMLLVFDFVAGRALDPSERLHFFALPVDRKLAALLDIFEAKLAIVENG